MSAVTYLILSATGRQGSAVVDALIAKNATIFATSRNPESLLKKRGTYALIRSNYYYYNGEYVALHLHC